MSMDAPVQVWDSNFKDKNKSILGLLLDRQTYVDTGKRLLYYVYFEINVKKHTHMPAIKANNSLATCNSGLNESIKL